MTSRKRTRTTSKKKASKTAKKSAPKKAARTTKKQTCLTMLARCDGATIEQLQKATGWQPHSVRGFLAGVAQRQEGKTLTSDKALGQARRCRIVSEAAANE